MEEQELLKYLKGNKKDDATLRKYQTLMTPEFREKLKKIWDNYKISMKKGEPDFNNMLMGIHKKLGLSKEPSHKEVFFIHSVNMFRRIAVILFIPLLISTFFLLFSSKQTASDELSMLEITTLPGTVTHLTLSDSTSVWLNRSTVFRYPREFKGKERYVFVDGEAYFEVKSDKDHPFVVDNPMMKTIVTGTKFNLNAFSKKEIFEASLLEGSVTLENGEQKLVLTPGFMAKYDTKTKSLTCREKPVALSMSWINGELDFEDEPLQNVFSKLSDWYNVDFVFRDDKLKNMLFTAKIKSENLDQFLDNMKKALSINYTIQEDDTLLRKKIYVAGTQVK